MSQKKPLKMLTEAELHKLNDQRLKGVMDSARAVKCSLAKQLSETIADTDEHDEVTIKAASANKYFRLVKSVRDTRQHAE